MAFDLDTYNTVGERIVEFRNLHPYGSLQSDIVLLPTEALPFVVVKAYAYRDPSDERPGIGLAWEPFPGKTSFTRDSELQNAETSAWGRAIVAALAADTKKGVASADEIKARQTAGAGDSLPPDRDPAPAPPSSGEVGTAPEASGPEAEGEAASGPATPEQRTRLLQVYKGKPASVKAKAVELFDRFEKVGDVLVGDLTAHEAEALILAAAS